MNLDKDTQKFYDTDSEQLQIDQRIAELEDEIRSLKTRRNSRSPISRIPRELLCEIFMVLSKDLYQQDAAFMRNLDTPSSPLPQWATVSHVSHCWRQVALGCPRLWTRISLSYSHGWVDVMLDRSSNAPIMVKGLYDWLPTQQNGTKAVLSQSQRLRSFALKVDPWRGAIDSAIIADFLGLLTKEMPALESLLLERPIWDPTGRFLPENLLGGFAPRLKLLSLLGWFPLRWDLSIFHGLKVLKLNCLSHRGYNNNDAFCILEGLAGMPQLKDLDLKLWSSSDSVPSHLSVVKLPFMQTLRLQFGSVCAIAAFLEHLALPATASMDLSCPDQPYHDTNIAAAFARLSQSLASACFSDPLTLLQPSNANSLSSVFVTDEEEESINVHGWLHPVLSNCEDTSLCPENAHFSLAIHDFINHGHSIILDRLPLTTLSEFCYRGSPEPSVITRVGGLQCLESLYLTGASMQALFTVIAESPHSTAPSSFFPSLTLLSVEEFYLTDQGGQYSENPFGNGFAIQKEDVLHFLRARVEAGKKLEKVLFKDCIGLSTGLIKDIETLCTDFKWDHMTSTLDYEL